MPKPDKVLRLRPLKEAGRALAQLRRVVLFHKSPIVVALDPQYCVCKQDEDAQMVQCDECYDWYHFGCVGLADAADVGGDAWKCEWCLSYIDKQGYQRWTTGRGRPSRRHHLDVPRLKGGSLGGDPPPRFSASTQWDGKVAEVKEMARRAAIKKRKLTEAVEGVMAGAGHHLADAEGMAGLEMRPVDDGCVDEMIEAGIVDENQFNGDD
jgi:hypothetical protein